MGSDLNVFKYGMHKPINITIFFRNIRQFFRNIKFAWQRVTRGYCDWDVWELNTFYTELIRDTLRYLANNSSSYPGRGDLDTPEKWKDWLNETAKLFDNSIERDFEDNQVYKNKYEDAYLKTFDKGAAENKELISKYLEEEQNIYRLRDRDKNKAIERLSEHWWELWD